MDVDVFNLLCVVECMIMIWWELFVMFGEVVDGVLGVIVYSFVYFGEIDMLLVFYVVCFSVLDWNVFFDRFIDKWLWCGREIFYYFVCLICGL